MGPLVLCIFASKYVPLVDSRARMFTLTCCYCGQEIWFVIFFVASIVIAGPLMYIDLVEGTVVQSTAFESLTVRHLEDGSNW